MVNPPRDPQTLASRLQSNRGDGRGKRRSPVLIDLDMRIVRDGTWYYNGTPITRKPLVRLFSTVLRHEDDGFFLITPVEKGPVQVEDAPFVAVEMTVSGSGRDQILSFRTNVDDWVAADAEHPIRVDIDPDTGEPSPYILVRDRLDALISRSVYYDLVELGVEELQGNDYLYGIWSKNVFFSLGILTESA